MSKALAVAKALSSASAWLQFAAESSQFFPVRFSKRKYARILISFSVTIDLL
jgi:hypothetical protein